MKKTTLLFLLSLCFFNLKTFAQNDLNFLSAPTGAACYEVCYYNDYLYAGAGNTLIAYHLTGANNTPGPKTFEYRFQSNIANIQVRNGFMYVSANHSGLSKWDVTNPDFPVFVDEIIPAQLDEAAYDITFWGDTIFMAYKTKIAVVQDAPASLTLLNTFAQKTGTSRINGLDVKGNVLAATVSLSAVNSTDGVYLYDTQSLAQIGFYNQTFCEPEDVLFGKNTNLLHVMGGTDGFNGVYYALDVSNPSSIQRTFLDTIHANIFVLGIASPMNAININDTIYIATQGGNSLPFILNPYDCGTYVYDATQSGSEHIITTLFSGLYHFDIDIHNGIMYVASEWYGVLTMDIHDLFNEVEIDRDLTGGWCIGADKHGNRMVQANEGYGIRLYDISDLQNPILIKADSSVGFCFNINYSSNGNYIYAYYLTNNRLRIFDANTLQELGHVAQDVGLKRTCTYQQKAISANNSKIFITDVSNPAAPVIQSQTTFAINDMLVTPQGKLIASKADSIIIFNINGTSPVRVGGIKSSFGAQTFKAMAFYMDTLYVYISGLGLAKYYFNNTNNTLTSLSTLAIANANPAMMAADAFGLYLGYITLGINIHDKGSLQLTGNYQNGLEYVHDNIWGIQNIVCKDSLILASEYFGQTSILTNNPGIATSVRSTENNIANVSNVFPNPASDKVNVRLSVSSNEVLSVNVYDAIGNLLSKNSYSIYNNMLVINTQNLSNGIYFVSVNSKKGIVTNKFVVAR